MQHYFRSSPRLIHVLIVLGCMGGWSWYARAAKPKPTAASKSAERERYKILIEIIEYHNKKHNKKIADDENKKIADDEIAKRINTYFTKHIKEITQGSSTTELLRVFVKDLILSISNHAYEIANNITKLNSTNAADAAKKIEQAKEITRQNIEHLPEEPVLAALSKALPAHDRDTALNLPKEVQKLLEKSNAEIADEEYKKLTDRLYLEATGKKHTPPAPAKPTAKPFPPAAPAKPAPKPSPAPAPILAPPAPEPAAVTTEGAPSSLAARIKAVTLKKVETREVTPPPQRAGTPPPQDVIKQQQRLVLAGKKRPSVSQRPQEPKKLEPREALLEQIKEPKVLAHSKESVALRSKADLEKQRRELIATQELLAKYTRETLTPQLNELEREEKQGKLTDQKTKALEAIKKQLEYNTKRLEQVKTQLATIEAELKILEGQGKSEEAPPTPKKYQSPVELQIQEKIAQQRTGMVGQETLAVEELRKELDKLLAKSNRTPADAKKIQDLQARIAQIEQQEESAEWTTD
ncbi:MAG: hypothetical protein WC365_05620 [Candidatus Babeliales bacterium]